MICEICMSNTISHILSQLNFICQETIKCKHAVWHTDHRNYGKKTMNNSTIHKQCLRHTTLWHFLEQSPLETWAFINPLIWYLASSYLQFPNTFSVFLEACGIFFHLTSSCLKLFLVFSNAKIKLQFLFYNLEVTL